MAAAAAKIFEDLNEFRDEEIREIRIMFAIDPPQPNGPKRVLDHLADNERVILKKVLFSMNECRFKVKIIEQRSVGRIICPRCGKPYKRIDRGSA